MQKHKFNLLKKKTHLFELYIITPILCTVHVGTSEKLYFLKFTLYAITLGPTCVNPNFIYLF